MKPAWVLLYRRGSGAKQQLIVGVFYSEPTVHSILRALCDARHGQPALCKDFHTAQQLYVDGLIELVETNCLDE